MAVLIVCLLLSVNSLAREALPPLQIVGCKSDGQLGLKDAPDPLPVHLLDRDKSEAAHLSYYAASPDLGALAPQGWYCLSTYGSNGSSLFISPRPLSIERILGGHHRFDGPFIQVQKLFVETSGRFAAARLIAVAMPGHRDFVDRVSNEASVSSKDFPSGPYPTDIRHEVGDNVVEFITPGHHQGIGTHSMLLKSRVPIKGVVVLGEHQLNVIDIRLPNLPLFVTNLVIQQAELDFKTSSK